MEITRGKLKKAQKVVIYGPEGIGKSTLASQFPGALFIDTEGSTNNMDVARTPSPTSWTMLNNIIDEVKANPSLCKTLVLDTVDWAEKIAIKQICSMKGWSGIEDPGWGKGYTYLEEETGRFLNSLSDLIERGINVVVNAHATMRKFEQPDELGAYDRWELKLQKKTAPLYKEWADLILFCNYKTLVINVDNQGATKGKNKAQGGARKMFTTHHPAWDAKNRHNLPDELPMDYVNIAHIFNDAPQMQKVPVHQPEPVVQPQQQVQIQQQPVQDPVPDKGIIEQSIQEQPPVQSAPPVTNTVQLNPMIPQALRDLMMQNGVSEEEIQIVVSNKGYYPMGTPILNYDPGFIDGVLVGAWQQVYGMVLEFRNSLPFS